MSALTKTLFALTVTSGLALSVHLQSPAEAEACGCFVPPDPTVPIVQAGERILFGQENGIITAHIQVQYSGAAEEFGWLLPMPAIPEMELGSDELFAQLIAQTQPTYRLDREYRGDCPFDPNRGGGGFGSPSNDSAGEGGAGGDAGSPLVLRDSIGPYDFAVLRANEKQPMLDWLDENGFFVPAGTDGVVDPYIQPDGYFLALKLLKGNDVGDLQPVVLKYQSDLPMIPIILTSVAADPNMGVQVWVLGDSRAIPRNYHHTKINDAALDWINAGANYVDVVTDAVDEIEGHHSFVTEYAGSSSVMVDVLDYQGRFGSTAQLAAMTNAEDFINYVNQNGYPLFTNSSGPNGFVPSYPALVLSILQSQLPVPSKLLEEDITPADYYWNIGFYLGYDREQRPEMYLDLDLEFSAAELAQQLEERVIEPTMAAGAMFRTHSYLSRMFTTLSPNEMTKDPVFSFNPDLPEVSNIHTGTITYYCHLIADPTLENTPAVLYTEQGFKLRFGSGTGGADAVNPYASLDMPQSQYQEVLREEGEPEVVLDNTELIRAALATQAGDGGGCSVGGGSSAAGLWLLALGLLATRRRRDN